VLVTSWHPLTVYQYCEGLINPHKANKDTLHSPGAVPFVSFSVRYPHLRAGHVVAPTTVYQYGKGFANTHTQRKWTQTLTRLSTFVSFSFLWYQSDIRILLVTSWHPLPFTSTARGSQTHTHKESEPEHSPVSLRLFRFLFFDISRISAFTCWSRRGIHWPFTSSTRASRASPLRSTP